MMKGLILLLVCNFIALIGFAQADRVKAQGTVEPLRIGASYNLTTNLIFPLAVRSVDKGSRDILVQKAEQVENILQLKAATKNFLETNLSVVTADGSFYSFLVGYTERPAHLNLKLSGTIPGGEPLVHFSEKKDNDVAYENTASLLSVKKESGKISSVGRDDITFCIRQIYLQDDEFYFRFELENNSQVKYDISQLRFYIQDRKKAKRTAIQEVEITPLYIYGNLQSIPAHSKVTLVGVLPKFTLADSKIFTLEVSEKNAGRQLKVKLKNRHLLKAQLL